MSQKNETTARRRLLPADRPRPKSGLWAFITLLCLSSAVTPATAKLSVVTTTPDLAALAREVGGDRVEVKSLCKGYQDSHYLEPKPSYARAVRDADLLIYVGLELESAWLPPLLDTARNPRLRPGSPGLMEAGAAVERILEVPEGDVDRSRGDIHPFGNPHLLLSPSNAMAVASAIARRLAALDPDGSDYYDKRLERLEALMTSKLSEWEAEARPLRGTTVVAYHKQWEYLADWLGMRIMDYVEDRPGIPPSPQHLESLIRTMKAHDIRIVMVATFSDVDAAREVARRAGARAVVLPAGVGGVEEARDYFELIDVILERLLSSLK